MCGIAGLYQPKQPFSRRDVQGMADALRHRGPDDEGYVLYRPEGKALTPFHGDDSAVKVGRHIGAMEPAAGGLLLGHRRLAIIDASPGGHQPMLSEDGKLEVVFNGEIYNHIELKEELAAMGTCSRPAPIRKLASEHHPTSPRTWRLTTRASGPTNPSLTTFPSPIR
jgi:asparagine synthase (glutamine-hydrolysing)